MKVSEAKFLGQCIFPSKQRYGGWGLTKVDICHGRKPQMCVWRTCESQDHKLWELRILGHKYSSGFSQGFLHHRMNIIYFVYCLKLDNVRSKQWPQSKRKFVCAVGGNIESFLLGSALRKISENFYRQNWHLRYRKGPSSHFSGFKICFYFNLFSIVES